MPRVHVCMNVMWVLSGRSIVNGVLVLGLVMVMEAPDKMNWPVTPPSAIAYFFYIRRWELRSA